MSSAAVIVSNSQFFSTSQMLFHMSAAISFVSLFRSKKSAGLCCTFLSGVKCKQKKLYSLCSGRALSSRSLTVFVISAIALCPIAHRNVSFISSSSCSRNCGSTSFELAMIDKSISFVISMYCANFRHQRFALELSCFSRLGMDSFWVHVRTPALIGNLIGYWPAACRLIGCPILLSARLWGGVVGVIHSSFGVGSC